MKRAKRFLAIAMAAVMTVSFAACGQKGGSGDTGADNGGKKVQIKYWNAGLGTAWLDAVIKAFNAKQSDWYVYYDATASAEATLSSYGQETVDTTDIYMTVQTYDTAYMEHLDELLETKAEGDEKTIGEKFNKAYLELEQAEDGHYYSLTHGGGGISFVYNKRLFEAAGISEVPRTTDELAAACDKLLSAGFTPLTHFTSGGYWHFLQEAWQAQYDGFDYYMNNFYACRDEEGNSPSKNVFTKKDGRYQVLKAMEKIVTPEYVMNGSNSSDHVTVQTKFINEDIGMMVNGSWMANEMKGTGNVDDFGVMKTPVISGIKDKLTTIKSDTELRKLISAIDSVTDGEKDVSEYRSGEGYVVNGKEISAADWDFVKAARNTVATNYSGEVTFIPTYSDAKEGAMEFLKFFYSDEGYKIYTDTLHINLPMQLSKGEIDLSGWSTFELEMYDVIYKAEYSVSNYNMKKHPIFTSGGASPYAGYSFVEYFSANNPSDRVTADKAWDNIMKLVEKNYEQTWLNNIQ